MLFSSSRQQVITEPVVVAVQFPQQVIDDDAASQNDTGFIHLHQLVALIIAVIFFMAVGIADGIFKQTIYCVLTTIFFFTLPCSSEVPLP